MTYWWDAFPEERYWVEIRTVPGIGEEVYSDILNVEGNKDPRWELVRSLRAGQVVFHYDADQSRFVGYSTVRADAVTEGDKYRAPLVDFHSIDDVVGLEWMREKVDDLFTLRDDLLLRFGSPLFLPFQFTENRSHFRMMSNYFAKMPIAVMSVLFDPKLVSALTGGGTVPTASARRRTAGGYLKPFRRKADTKYRATTSAIESFRARSHETLVNDCSIWLASQGFTVGNNAAIDLGIFEPPVIIEAKTVSTSWPLAIRAGIAQLYEYRYFKVGEPNSALVLLVDEKPPTDWLKYLESDRKIGVIWRDGSEFSLSSLAQRQLYGSKRGQR